MGVKQTPMTVFPNKLGFDKCVRILVKNLNLSEITNLEIVDSLINCVFSSGVLDVDGVGVKQTMGLPFLNIAFLNH